MNSIEHQKATIEKAIQFTFVWQATFSQKIKTQIKSTLKAVVGLVLQFSRDFYFHFKRLTLPDNVLTNGRITKKQLPIWLVTNFHKSKVLVSVIAFVLCYYNTYAQTNNDIFNGGSADGFSFSAVGSWDNEVALPIELLSYTAICKNKNVILKWSTATEINNDYFTLERNTDGTDWQIVGLIKGAGNSSIIRNYEFIDNSEILKLKPETVLYYRLKHTDFEGKFKYSDIIAIENCLDKLTELIVYPNPANGILSILFNGDKRQIKSVEIYNVLGEKVYNSYDYQSAIDLSNKPNGMYFIYFKVNSKIITEKIIIKR